MDPYVEELRTEREMKDRFMGRHGESPFVAEGLANFAGLRYFPISPRYRIRGRLERIPTPTEAHLRTNRDGHAVVRYLGDLVFTLDRRTLRLRVFHAGEGVGRNVFVPFRDATSGEDTYGPGRYLTFELNAEDEYDIDFNRAFNPYCAYTDAYECSFPPSENDLPVAIRAGEKVWDPDRNPRTPSSAVRALLPPKASPKGPPARRPARPTTSPARPSAGASRARRATRSGRRA